MEAVTVSEVREHIAFLRAVHVASSRGASSLYVNGARLRAAAREYFAWRVRRRLAQDGLVKALKGADANLAHADAVAKLADMMGGDWEDDRAVLGWFDSAKSQIDELVQQTRDAAIQKTVAELVDGLSAEAKAALLKSL